MKFSHIIPIHNEDVSILKRCIDSILHQKYTDYEVILIDDGSTNPNISPFCKKLSKKTSNVIYIYQKNQGSAAARNTGLDAVTGDFIVFVDADDYLDNNFFPRINKHIGSADILCFDYVYQTDTQTQFFSLRHSLNLANEKSKVYRNVLLEPDIYDNFIFGALWGKIISRKFIEDNKIRFIPELRKTQDRVFMLECYAKAEVINYVPILGYHYCLRQGSITHKFNLNVLDHYERLQSAIKEKCSEFNIPYEYTKFFTFGIFLEAMQLTYFHRACTAKGKELKTLINDAYSLFDFENTLRQLHLSDFKKFKSKVKLLLLKLRTYRILKLYFQEKGL